ncbi:MAG: epoxyqueuosine reductase QueH [Thermoplasmata archaeon]
MRLLLHACCAPCSTWSIETLRKEYELTCFFHNPNIQPREEYEARLSDTKRYCSAVGITLVEGEYEIEKWNLETRGHEDDPEGGERCGICYRIRLEGTGARAAEGGFDAFSTTLTTSPHKDAGVINRIGEEIGGKVGVPFLSLNLKKQDGFKKSVEMSRQHNLYRQEYCGCVYSQRKSTV